VRLLLAVTLVTALAAAAAPVGGATNECHGIQQCIPIAGPWVVVPAHGTAAFLLACPRGRSVVGGLDALATSRSVHVGFDARLGAPVQPGVTTTRYALFRAVSTSSSRQAFQPRLGCIPVQGGGGRSTVSATLTPPGPSIEALARIIIVGSGATSFGRVTCPAGQTVVGAWHSLAFRTKTPPRLSAAQYIRARHVVLGRQVVVTASSTDALSVDVHAIVQAGVECAS
jgi:hypothetical protein